MPKSNYRASGLVLRPEAVVQPTHTSVMTDRMRKLILLISILVAGILVFVFAGNVMELWVLWLLTIGFFFGSALASPMSRFPVVLCGLSVLAIATTLVCRSFPIYSLDWRLADRVEISDLEGTMKIVLTDPREISALMQYGEAGHYESMIKSGTNIHLYVSRNGTSHGYYVHGNAIGQLPGGRGQTVFVPERDGFFTTLEGILARHGHKK
jgi:hypothetical protein